VENGAAYEKTALIDRTDGASAQNLVPRARSRDPPTKVRDCTKKTCPAPPEGRPKPPTPQRGEALARVRSRARANKQKY